MTKAAGEAKPPPADREKLVAELKAAEARMDAGEFVIYDREDQRSRFEKIYSARA